MTCGAAQQPRITPFQPPTDMISLECLQGESEGVSWGFERSRKSKNKSYEMTWRIPEQRRTSMRTSE